MVVTKEEDMIINHAWCIEHENRRDRREVDNRLGMLVKRLTRRRGTPVRVTPTSQEPPVQVRLP
ncbi:hypothetical protein DMH04_49245 [Kibdelosporangium aridum]|uniref:Uncharacterized protein n=1 Tax=Kibdelosporangium aridum TaxID=2030 RepID=A0A428YCM4_KIBAR|nr:hypothetical protein DMH04_49245 [Kibdelosporangium aridum]